MRFFILILLVLVQFIMCGQESNVSEILESDTIKFDLHETGCFHNRTEKIIIMKQSANLYQLKYTKEGEKPINKNISKVDLIKFGRVFSIEKNKTHRCVSTTSTLLVLSSSGKSASFKYNGCDENPTPMKALKKELHL